MNKTTMPFWVEGMSPKERNHQISSLFTMLEKKLAIVPKNKKASAICTFVFVPDPPPLKLNEQTQCFDIYHLSWGVAGQAVATEVVEEAIALAPVIFDLWSESLYVIAFKEKASDSTTLEQWVNEVLRIEFNDESSNKSNTLKLPSYSLVIFDWGDLVNE